MAVYLGGHVVHRLLRSWEMFGDAPGTLWKNIHDVRRMT